MEKDGDGGQEPGQKIVMRLPPASEWREYVGMARIASTDDEAVRSDAPVHLLVRIVDPGAPGSGTEWEVVQTSLLLSPGTTSWVRLTVPPLYQGADVRVACVSPSESTVRIEITGQLVERRDADTDRGE